MLLTTSLVLLTSLAPSAEPVEPGDVRWHATPPAAEAASRDSGKPVLVFQLLGRLDERFC